jgi:hypothetical protein
VKNEFSTDTNNQKLLRGPIHCWVLQALPPSQTGLRVDCNGTELFDTSMQPVEVGAAVVQQVVIMVNNQPPPCELSSLDTTIIQIFVSHLKKLYCCCVKDTRTKSQSIIIMLVTTTKPLQLPTYDPISNVSLVATPPAGDTTVQHTLWNCGLPIRVPIASDFHVLNRLRGTCVLRYPIGST